MYMHNISIVLTPNTNTPGIISTGFFLKCLLDNNFIIMINGEWGSNSNNEVLATV